MSLCRVLEVDLVTWQWSHNDGDARSMGKCEIWDLITRALRPRESMIQVSDACMDNGGFIYMDREETWSLRWSKHKLRLPKAPLVCLVSIGVNHSRQSVNICGFVDHGSFLRHTKVHNILLLWMRLAAYSDPCLADLSRWCNTTQTSFVKCQCVNLMYHFQHVASPAIPLSVSLLM